MMLVGCGGLEITDQVSEREAGSNKQVVGLIPLGLPIRLEMIRIRLSRNPDPTVMKFSDPWITIWIRPSRKNGSKSYLRIKHTGFVSDHKKNRIKIRPSKKTHRIRIRPSRKTGYKSYRRIKHTGFGSDRQENRIQILPCNKTHLIRIRPSKKPDPNLTV